MAKGRRAVAALVCATLLTLGAADGAAAQKQVLTTAGGMVAGVAAGGYVALSVIVLRSRFGHFVESERDVLGWGSVPVLVGGGTGAFLGFTDPDRLVRTIIGGSVGTAVGLGVGLVVGRRVATTSAGRWAGGAMGAGGGLVLGSLIGLFLPGKSGSDSPSPQAARAAAIPIGVTVRF